MSKPTSTTERRKNFERLVREAETLIATQPQTYRRKVAGLAVLGYLVLFGLLALLLILLGGGIWLVVISHSIVIFLLKSKLIIAIPVLIWLILKSLWVKLPAPEGYELKKQDFPTLFAEIEQLRLQLNAAEIHQVILTDEFNAGITQIPQLGVFGRYKNILILGLPLLLALSPEQARAALAHEFGHLSANHSRFNAWIYRVRKTWHQVAIAFEQSDTALVAKFFNWYAPYFDAYSFALARANEYEADAISAELTSNEAAAQCLLMVSVYGNLLGKHYWEPFIDPGNHRDITLQSPYGDLAQFFHQPPLSHNQLSDGLKRAYAVETNYDDTHPAMKDRLAALQISPVIPAPRQQSAAQVWFGEAYEKVLDDFDQEWIGRNALDLKEQAEYRRNAIQELAQLQARVNQGLTQQEKLSMAYLTRQLRGEVAGLVLYDAYLAQYPDDLDIQLSTGRLKLLANDESGIEHLKLAMQNFLLVLPACEAAYSYYERSGNKLEALRWRERGEAQMDLQNKGLAERSIVLTTDVLHSAEINAEQIANLRQQLQQIKGIKQAWICQKQLEVAPEQDPVYVLAYQAAGLFPNEAKFTKKLIENISFQHTTFLVMKDGSGTSKAIAKRVITMGLPLL